MSGVDRHPGGRDIRMAARRSGTDIHPTHGTTRIGPSNGVHQRQVSAIWSLHYRRGIPILCTRNVLLRLVTDNSMQHKILLCALLALIGLCFAVVLPPLDAEVFHAVKEKEDQTPDLFGRGGAMALAFGLSNMGFAAGSLIGPVFAGSIRQRAGWGTMGWALGLMAVVSSIPILLFLGGWILGEPVRSVDEAQVPESASGS
ncbi:hypothetical protein V1527DRAFT_479534 [Lipomyces starkeyi]